MTRRKLFGTVAFVFAMVIAIAALGQIWIKSSEPYELGRAAVVLGSACRPLRLNSKRLAPFQFADGDFSGEALFVLCTHESRCFTVVAKKRDARWSVVDLVERLKWLKCSLTCQSSGPPTALAHLHVKTEF